MPSPLGYSSVSSASLTGNAQVDSLIYGTYWTHGASTTSLTYSFMTTNSYFSRFYSDYNEYQSGYVLDPAQKTAIVSALAEWSSVANIKFTEVNESYINVGDLRFGGYGDMDNDTAAWGYFPGRSAAAGDVWIGPATNDQNPVQGSYDYLTFMHEIGHALGLKHPFSQGLTNSTVLATQYDDVRYTIMSYTNAYSYEPTTPMLLDIAAIQRLYGANTQWQTGNNTYSWATDQSVFETIWDAGGNDTIDGSNQAEAVRINLNEGQFSKIGQAFLDSDQKAFNEGLAIAYGAKIENAVGSANDDTLIGNALGNFLNGLAGKDTMIGGAGNDTYVVDNLADVVSETSALASEIDTVRSSVSWTLGANLENLTLTGSDNLNGTGNALSNVLTGNSGNNVLDGGAGADTLIGGTGNDIYVVDNLKDIVNETSTPGSEVDTVRSSVSWTLGSNLENLTLTGTALINGTGNGLSNVLIGNAAANVLNGLGGADTMIGGAGNDTYVVDTIGDTITEAGTSLTEIDSVLSSVSYALGSNLENLTLTGIASINAIGNELNNRLTGNSGANTLDGGAGIDTLVGGTGNDTYVVDNLHDLISETSTLASEIDTVRSSVSWVLGANLENLTLTGTATINGTGNALGNVLTGNTGNNVLDGGLGADTLIGGTGNDTYIVDNLKDVISETSTLDSEIDTVRSSVSWTLGANLENLTLTGVAAINATGNALDNVLIGNAAANVLNGLGGADTMIGGAGNDTYVVDNIGDTITEAGTSLTEIDSVLSSISYTLGTNLEILTLTGTGSIDGTGNALNNRITGNAGANVLDGGLGIDTLIGGTGNDTYVVDNLKDVISETSTLASEIDTVRSSVSWALGANLENLTLTGTAAINGTGNALGNVLTGNAGNNVLNGGAGRDTLIGGAGNDTYVLDQAGELALLQEHADQGIDSLSLTYASSSLSSVVDLNLSNLVDVENVILNGAGVFTVIGNSQDNSLVGNAFVNTLQGGAGDDTLDGRAGADILIGGAGDDIYVIDNLGDKVTELTDEGHDLIRTAVSYTLSTNVEDGQLLGLSAINLSGNALDNSLVGNAAANVLNGLGGADTMIGGAGNDTYVVDNVGDTITEAGTSLTEVDSVLSSISYTLGTNLEILTLTGTGGIDGTGNALNNRITGNAGANVLDGGVGIDTLVGGTGNDTYVVDNLKDVVSETSTLASEIDTVRSSVSWALGANLENLTLTGTAAINGTGNALANVLTGNAGNNVLDGGAGRDTLIGGAGNDTYLIDNLGDTVTELADEGRDLVRTSVSHTLSTNVEDGQLLGIAAINLVGNASNNTLLGNSAANVLSGLDGADILDGGAGIDTLIGGTGNDTYVVDNLKDVISETSTLDSEIDTVRSSVSWTLGANLENLTLTGVAAINATGNALDNVLIGNAASNTLIGGAGNDQLDGGAGNDLLIGGIGTDTLTGGVGGDRFVFSALNELGIGDARDVILDFSRLQGDKLDLSKLDANILATGINKFSFIDSADFSGAGQLRFVDHVLSGNIDGNLGADFEIQLVGVNTFSANDLVA
ncbi:matrixin family metalloprotease [Pseudomonas mediterranea]|uniref:matrixin family metalloprotease n=1 Tax=Pseudomonas mediterranea TaxID=183795 RepID=UPI0006D892D5|nr:M10 family metallopeptidase C-terminal domain-containing protein [Pseudomonas mediterranea]MDU9027737.1 M10 family metallopeptidase C-terminal domain-containing protein [Pseudomonas mediterranea]